MMKNRLPYSDAEILEATLEPKPPPLVKVAPETHAKRLDRIRAQMAQDTNIRNFQRVVVKVKANDESTLSCRHSNFYGKKVGEMVGCIACQWVAMLPFMDRISRMGGGEA